MIQIPRQKKKINIKNKCSHRLTLCLKFMYFNYLSISCVFPYINFFTHHCPRATRKAARRVHAMFSRTKFIVIFIIKASFLFRFLNRKEIKKISFSFEKPQSKTRIQNLAATLLFFIFFRVREIKEFQSVSLCVAGHNSYFLHMEYEQKWPKDINELSSDKKSFQ